MLRDSLDVLLLTCCLACNSYRCRWHIGQHSCAQFTSHSYHRLLSWKFCDLKSFTIL